MDSRLPYRLLLAAIVVAYAAIGVLYAMLTPAWQVPDEPAHYNYVRALAEGRGFPVLQPGDYDQDYLSRLTTERFPAELPIDAVEYEDHQPPLYYLLAVPVYRLFGGALLPLRLFSVLLGALLLPVAYRAVRALFPARTGLAVVVAACIAFVPQHVAMSAGVENDALAELVLASTLWALVVYVGGRHERPWPAGLLLAAALLTKTTVYGLLGVAVVAVALRWRLERRTWRWAAGQLLWVLVPALAISAPWFVRNGIIYGWRDPFGLVRHGEVVEGQLRSSQAVALYGWRWLLTGLVRTTFQSFWCQLGWMAVPLPARVYQGLALFSAVLAAGFLWWLFDRRRPRLTPFQRAGLALFLASTLLTLLEFLGYNLTFVQHQGRYLFTALVPLGTAAALGLEQLAGVLPRRWRPWVLAILFAGLVALDVYCLFKSIPFLRP